MAFPAIASSGANWNTGSTAINNFDPSHPTAASAGDLLIIIAATDGVPTYTWPGGWTSIFATSSGTACRMEGRYRIADGTEDDTYWNNLSIGLSASEGWAYVAMRITGWHGTTAPEAGTATNTTKPDPPSFNPTGWDIEDTLWLACGCTDAGGADSDDISAVSSGYTLVATLQNSGTDAGGVNLGVGSLNSAVASVDPGAFTTATNEDTVGATVAIRPAAAAAAGSLIIRRDPLFALIGR